MLDRLESSHGLANGFRRAPRQAGQADGCQNVFEIVRALQRDFRDRKNFTVCAFFSKENLFVADERSGCHLVTAAEMQHRARDVAGELVGGGIVCVEDAVVFRFLIFKNAGFGINVGLERAMAVEMIGRDIEDAGNKRPKRLRGLKLEAGDFEDGESRGGSLFDQRNCRRSDIAADYDREPRGSEDFASQRRGRRLAVRTGDGHRPAQQKPGREFDFADDRHAL